MVDFKMAAIEYTIHKVAPSTQNPLLSITTFHSVPFEHEQLVLCLFLWRMRIVWSVDPELGSDGSLVRLRKMDCFHSHYFHFIVVTSLRTTSCIPFMEGPISSSLD